MIASKKKIKKYIYFFYPLIFSLIRNRFCILLFFGKNVILFLHFSTLVNLLYIKKSLRNTSKTIKLMFNREKYPFLLKRLSW